MTIHIHAPKGFTVDTRRRDLSMIHIAIKEIGMTGDDHRSLLIQKFGVSSSSQLNQTQRGQYIAHLKKLGFKPNPTVKAGSKISRTMAHSPEMRKARAIWLMLHHIGVVRDPSESALAAWGKRMGKVDALQWQRRPDVLIEGLKTWAMRHLPSWVEHQPRFISAAPVVLKASFEDLQQAEPVNHLHILMKELFLTTKGSQTALFDRYWPIWECLGAKNVQA